MKTWPFLFGLVALLFVVTGCPRNDYIVQLTPQEGHLERTLVFYCADGTNSAGVPNYHSFDTNELATIQALYPANGFTSTGDRHRVTGDFTKQMPSDVGGAGEYVCYTNSLGTASVYMERFRGNNDLAGMTEKRFHAADELTDLLLGWTRTKLWREPHYPQLRRFLDRDFRNDLKNLSSYWWEAEVGENFNTNANEEFLFRFGQYLLEHDYFTLSEIPGVIRDFSGPDNAALGRRIQRLAARKMGVADDQPVPASLAFLTNTVAFDDYVAGTDPYHAQLKQWQQDKRLKPDLKRPEPEEVVNDLGRDLIAFQLFGEPDHLAVQLALPAAPEHSNGRWDARRHLVVWDTTIEERSESEHLPYACYASWAKPAETFQKQHLGAVVLAGDPLSQYCLWRSSLDARHAAEWDGFLATLEPGNDLVKQIGAFRFSDEQIKGALASDTPRQLLTEALK